MSWHCNSFKIVKALCKASFLRIYCVFVGSPNEALKDEHVMYCTS